ncbi:MAG: outer membrane beta-barrel family protein, partial [Bacteroidota bacterium]
DSKLNTDTEGLVVDRQFGAFFPTALVSHQFNEQWSSNFSYSRRITRPTFNEIAPFVYFLDPNTFFSGNSGLQPAITDAIKLDLNYKNIFFSAQYAVQDSAIARFQQQYDPTTERLIFVSENLKNATTWSFTLGMPLDITPWWNMRINATYYCLENNGYINEELTSITQHYAQINTNQSFQLPFDLSAELAFVYTGPSLWGKNRIGANYDMTIGLQKQLGERGGTLRFNVMDVLDSNRIRLSSYEPTQNFFFNGDFDLSQRTFSLSYTRRFGNNKVKAERYRAVGAAEELKRTN